LIPVEEIDKKLYKMKKISLLLLLLLSLKSISFSQFPRQNMDPVNWSFSQEKISDGVFVLKFNATIDKPWHMYAIEQEQSGPIPTNFTFVENKNLVFLSELTELIKPVVKFDEGFRFNIGAYYGRAEFTRKVEVIGPADQIITGEVEYQCCDDETCLPPFSREFSFTLEGKSDMSPAKPVQTSNIEKIVIRDTIAADVQEVVVEEEFTHNNETLLIEAVPGISDEGKSDRSMAGFLLITFLLGLAAILTPCVYPMIPMTISFFMRGSQNKALVVVKGLVFGLSMILVYTGLGVLVALTGLDANFGNIISTHWIPNLIFFILFMIFAASFLGMFEIVLPSGLVNKVDKQADKGGLIGPFFMGITTVLVSFSCTGPIVGSLLTEAAAGGNAMKPILGMFFFSLAFALPFTLLAIFPSMLKSMPKSGGWLNAVKVILGFMMLAFGMKFLSSMDQAYHLNIFTREMYLAIWFVIAMMMGLYLLGKIKFPHDSEMNGVSVPRLLLAMASFVFAVYLFTGIFGNDLKAISSMIPPKSSQQFNIVISAASETTSDNQDATYCGPGEYNDIFELPYGIKGYFKLEDGLACAKTKNKPIFLDFTGHSCSNCKQMESQVWSDPEILKILKEEYVIISLYTDDKTKLPESEWVTNSEGKVLKTIGEINVNYELQKFTTFATPWYVLMDGEGNLLADPIGKELNIEKFKAFLEKGLK
jgi:thiol:disulfide interchange protein